jgi:hypothetical protein
MLGKAVSVQIYHGLICDKRTWIRYNYQTIVVENNIIVKTPKIHSCLFIGAAKRKGAVIDFADSFSRECIYRNSLLSLLTANGVAFCM